MSRFHFHRVFKIVTGITPKAYALTRRTTRVRAALPPLVGDRGGLRRGIQFRRPLLGERVRDAGHETGDVPRWGERGSDSFRCRRVLLRSILVAATASGICAITFGDDPNALVHELERRFPRAQLGGQPVNPGTRARPGHGRPVFLRGLHNSRLTSSAIRRGGSSPATARIFDMRPGTTSVDCRSIPS